MGTVFFRLSIKLYAGVGLLDDLYIGKYSLQKPVPSRERALFIRYR